MPSRMLSFKQRGRQLQEFIDKLRLGVDGAPADRKADVVKGRANRDDGFDALSFFQFNVYDVDFGTSAATSTKSLALAPGRGVGVRDAEDRGLDKLSIDGDEVLALNIGSDAPAVSARIKVRDVFSNVGVGAPGANKAGRKKGGEITVEAYRDGVKVGEQTVEISKFKGVINFNSDVAFDEVRISAADDATRFKVRDVDVEIDETAAQRFAVEDFTGDGQVVVVIDTGWSPTYQGGAEAPIAEFDFRASNALGVEDSDATSSRHHGAQVTQVLHQTATDADVIQLKIFSENGGATESDAEQALQWVIDHLDDYNIVAVNLSFGGGSFTRDARTSLSDEFQFLRDNGVISVAAAGNSGQTSVTNPAADENVLAVSGVRAGSDDISRFSQQHPDLTDIFAFSENVAIERENGRTTFGAGTSFAAPQVSGAVAIVQQAADALLDRRLTQDEFVDLIQKTGDDIEGYDRARDPDGYHLLNVDAAVQHLIDHTDDYFLFA